jgi:hypothetical protein
LRARELPEVERRALIDALTEHRDDHTDLGQS